MIVEFANVLSVVAITWWLVGCSTTASNSSAIAASQKEMMLSRAGFVSKAVTTPKQQEQVEKLPVGVVSAVTCKGKLLYVYPTEKKDQIFVGKQFHYDTYKNMVQTQAAKARASAARQAQQQDNGAYLTGETAWPNRIIIQEFDGFGPMPDNPGWQ